MDVSMVGYPYPTTPKAIEDSIFDFEYEDKGLHILSSFLPVQPSLSKIKARWAGIVGKYITDL